MKFLALFALLATLMLTACGSDDDGGNRTGDAPAPIGTNEEDGNGDTGGNGDDKPGKVDLAALSAIDANKHIISTIMSSLPSGQVLKAKGRTATQCGGIGYSYSVTPVGESMKIGLKTYFTFRDGMNSDEKKDMVIKTKKCLKPVQEFYGRYNIVFDWSTASPLGGKFSKSEADFSVVLDSEDGRASSLYWYADSFDKTCRVIVHEIGHLLGLPDEYAEEGTCRSPHFQSEGPSMMKDHTDGSAQFLPRHILALLEQALVSNVTIQSERSDIDLVNEARNLKAELNAYGCDLVSPQNLASYLTANGSVSYWESELSSYISAQIKMADGNVNKFFNEWTYWENNKWNRPTEFRCAVQKSGLALFQGEQFPLIYEALGSSAIKVKYTSSNLTELHKLFPPLIYSNIDALRYAEVEESEASETTVERNYY